MTHIISTGDATLKRRLSGIDVLDHDRQARGIEIAKSRQIRRGKGSVGHAEVFLTVRLRTPIMENLDTYPEIPTLTRPTPLKCEEPLNLDLA